MTDERRKWLLDVKASVENQLAGGETEYQRADGAWVTNRQLGFFPTRPYRPKPVPTYRPFTLAESGRLLGKVVYHPESYDRLKFRVSGISESGDMELVYDGVGPRPFFRKQWNVSEFHEWVFADMGTLCGVPMTDASGDKP